LVRVDTKVDWHEEHKMLRAEFYPTIYSDSVNCDIQFGSINRSTKNQTGIEKAQFEICAHKYVAVQNGEATFAIINNCKFGHRVKDGLMSLNLLRSPKYPDPQCDMGEHSFSYAIYVSEGNVEDNDLVARSYEFSYPLISSAVGAQLPNLLQAEGNGVILETIKPSENGKGIVARLYEKYGKEANCKLNVGFEYKAVYQTSMLERAAENTSTELTFKPFEIKTIYFEI
jgi:alpha-mannosidase